MSEQPSIPMITRQPKSLVDWNYSAPVSGCGIITGADANQEWLLPWWWVNYSAHNQLPVVFVDYGMSPKFRDWCAERGRVVRVDTSTTPVMQAKPLALLRSPFEKTLWLDADCEVLASVQPILDAVGTGVVGVSHDPFYAPVATHLSRRYVPVTSGLVVYSRDDAMISAWAAAALQHPGIHSDQVALNALHAMDRFCILPRRFHWLRLDENATVVTEPPLVRHWSGSVGKAHIEAEMIRAGLLRPKPKADDKTTVLKTVTEEKK